jgi:hypothetical protein
MTSERYIANKTEPLLQVPDPRGQLVTSLTKIVRGCAPRKLPWTDTFKSQPQGLWTGPTSLAYLFLWLSHTHPNLEIDGKLPIDWCHAYLDCGQQDIPSAAGLNGWGVKNEYLAYNTVKASATKDIQYVFKLRDAVANGFECPELDNEHLSGRAGTLALLRIVRHWVPHAAAVVQECMTLLITTIIERIPWRFHGHSYIGAAHGSIGIITQIVLCEPYRAREVIIESEISKLVDLQAADGHWFITEDPELGESDLVHYCHGSPGFVLSLLKMRPSLSPALQERVDVAVEKGQKEVWEKGLLRKEPNLCHGITGNMLALTDWKQREHFLAHATAEKVEEGKKNGDFIAGDDRFGLLWGEGGRAWGWMMLDSREELGYPSYTDI